MKTTTSHRWLPLWINLLLLAIAIGMYAPFGLRGNFGLFEEFGARYGHIRTSLVTRPTGLWSFQLADWLAPDSFVGFNWLMMACFWLKGALMVGMMRRLFPQQITLAVVAGLLLMVYPADSGSMTLRSIAIHFLMVCAMAAMYGMIRYWQKPHWAWWLWIVPLQILALAYEIYYLVFMLVPLIWLAYGITRRGILLTLAWGTTPLILGLRVVWLMQTDRAGYVTDVMALTNVREDTLTTEVARRSLQALFERHLTGWQSGLELLLDTPYGPLAVLVGILSSLLVWGFYRPPSFKWRMYGIILVAGLVFMLAAYVLYLPTLYRMDSFRVNILTSLGATLSVCAVLIGITQALGKGGRYWLAAWTAVLMMSGMAFQLDQAEHYQDLSANLQRLFGGIVTAAPHVEADTVIVYIDSELDYQDPMQLGGSSFYFNAGIQFLYDDKHVRGVMCVLRPDYIPQACAFTPNGLFRIDDFSHEERLPYERLIVMVKGQDGRPRLLTKLPPEYVNPYSTTTPAAYDPMQRVNLDAGPPDRVHGAFPCWPLEQCLDFPPAQTPVNTVRVEMDTLPFGTGWEPNDLPSGLRWTISTHATLHLNLATSEPLQVQFKVVYYVAPEILDGLALMVNGVDIPLTQSVDNEAGWLYSGVIPVEALQQNPYDLDVTLLVIRTDRTISPKEVGLNEDTRLLGVLIDWVAVGPMTP